MTLHSRGFDVAWKNDLMCNRRRVWCPQSTLKNERLSAMLSSMRSLKTLDKEALEGRGSFTQSADLVAAIAGSLSVPAAEGSPCERHHMKQQPIN